MLCAVAEASPDTIINAGTYPIAKTPNTMLIRYNIPPIRAVFLIEFFMSYKLVNGSSVKVSLIGCLFIFALPTLIHYRRHQFSLFELLWLPLFCQVQGLLHYRCGNGYQPENEILLLLLPSSGSKHCPSERNMNRVHPSNRSQRRDLTDIQEKVE